MFTKKHRYRAHMCIMYLTIYKLVNEYVNTSSVCVGYARNHIIKKINHRITAVITNKFLIMYQCLKGYKLYQIRFDKFKLENRLKQMRCHYNNQCKRRRRITLRFKIMIFTCNYNPSSFPTFDRMNRQWAFRTQFSAHVNIDRKLR